MTRPALVLASASPRRRALLDEAGIPYELEPSDGDESLDEEQGARLSPEEVAVHLAERKARAVAAGRAQRGEELLVLGADTVVALGEGREARLLGKPEDAADARSMLRALSGTRHRVITGVCLVRTRDGRAFAGYERTFVTMREIAPAEVEAYVASGEWEGKAGGYAIQETADAFVVRLEEGGFDNVVGLPVRLVRELLGAAGA